MEAILNKPQKAAPQQNYQQDPYEEETEDQRVRRLVKQQLDEEREKERQERQKQESQQLPQKLSQTYRDFDQICSTENLDYLEYHYPEVAGALKYMPDGFEKWSSIYQAVKRFIPNTDSKRDQSKAEKNFNQTTVPIFSRSYTIRWAANASIKNDRIEASRELGKNATHIKRIIIMYLSDLKSVVNYIQHCIKNYNPILNTPECLAIALGEIQERLIKLEDIPKIMDQPKDDITCEGCFLPRTY